MKKKNRRTPGTAPRCSVKPAMVAGNNLGPNFKNPAAVALGKLAAGQPKQFTAAERARRRKRLAEVRAKRWPASESGKLKTES